MNMFRPDDVSFFKDQEVYKGEPSSFIGRNRDPIHNVMPEVFIPHHVRKVLNFRLRMSADHVDVVEGSTSSIICLPRCGHTHVHVHSCTILFRATLHVPPWIHQLTLKTNAP